MSQEQTRIMLEAVGAANERLAELGLGDTHMIVYGGRPARAELLDAKGETLCEFVDEDPVLACAALYNQVEWALERLLRGL